MNEYSTINKTAEAAGPLADLEAVERVRNGIVKAATQHWRCHIMERSNLDQALRYAELNDQLRNMSGYIVACPVCGRPVRYDHLAEDAYGDDMCPDCLIAAGYVKCDHCGEWIDEDETTEVDGETWCSACVDSDAEPCDHCGEYHNNSDNLETVHVWISYRCDTIDEAWCESCRDDSTYTCDSCGEFYAGFGDCYGETLVHGRDGEENYRHLCPSCEDQLPHCYGCGSALETDCYRDAYGDAYCCDCKPESKYLQGYDHTYASNYYRAKDDPTPAGLYLGVELETEAYRTENPEALARDVIMAVGDERVVCKEDGSLTDGCEIVTQPMSAAYHLAPLDDLGGRRLWDVILDTCAEHNARSHNGVLRDYQAAVKPGVSDTVAYVRDVALYLANDAEVRRCGGLAVSRLAADMLRDSSQGSRLAIMDGHGNVRLTGAGWEDVQPGIHASNDSWRPFEPVYRCGSYAYGWDSPDRWPDWEDLDGLEQPMLWDDWPTAAAVRYADETYTVSDVFEEYYTWNNYREFCEEYTECRYHCARCGSLPYCATDDDLKRLGGRRG